MPRAAALLALMLAIAGPVSAQQPLPVGTAAGAGLGAMTEARLAEAATWNPALAAIFDGPMASVGVLGTHIEPGALKLAYDVGKLGWTLSRDPVSTVGERERNVLLGWRGEDGESRMRAEGAVQWLGIHSRDILINLASYGYADYRAPDRVLAIMAGEEQAAIGAPTAEEIDRTGSLLSHRSAVSVLSIAKGSDLGVMPHLGRTWVGVTVKAAYVHDHAIGRFGYTDPALVAFDMDGLALDPDASIRDGEVAGLYSEVGVQGARVYGLDVGAVVNPWAPVLISASVTNLVQKASLSVEQEDLYGRGIAFAGEDDAGNGRAFAGVSPLDVTAGEKPWLADAEFLARGTHFTPVARVGVSVDTHKGRFIAGYALPLEREYALDRASLDEYSFGWQSTSHQLKPRLVYTRRLDGSSGVMAGLQRGFCTDRLAVGAGYIDRPDQGRTLSFSVSWSRGSGPCGRFR